MTIRSKTAALFFISLVLALSAAGVYAFFLREILEGREEIARLEAERSRVSARNVTTASLIRAIKETERERSRLEEYFVDQDEVAAFLEALEGLEEDAGVEASLSSAAIVGERPQLAVSGRAEGSFDGLMRFMRLAETLPYAIRLSEASVRRDELATESLGRNVWSLRFTAIVSSVKEE